MNVLGWIAAVVIAVVVVAGVVTVIMSIPDIRRYVRIRQM